MIRPEVLDEIVDERIVSVVGLLNSLGSRVTDRHHILVGVLDLLCSDTLGLGQFVLGDQGIVVFLLFCMQLIDGVKQLVQLL